MSLLRSARFPAVLLLLAAAAGLVLANSPLRDAAFAVADAHLGIPGVVDLSVRHWISDGLLAVFFFVAAVELQFELTSGQLASARRAVLPQASALSFPFTVREIVRLGLTGGYSGLPLAEEGNLPDIALQRVDLGGQGRRLYQELSGGEQQRVQLARVLCQVWRPVVDGVPRYLFLDEPVSNLDIRHQIVVMEIARGFAEAGGGVIAIMHDLNLTAMFADRIAVMCGGRLDTIAPPQEALTDERLERVYECALRVGVLPARNVPFVLPQSAIRAAAE